MKCFPLSKSIYTFSAAALSCQRTIEMNRNKRRNKTVLFQPKQNAKTAMNRFGCFGQSQPVSVVYSLARKQRIQTVTGCNS